MPDVVFSVDQARSMRDRAVAGHNRWHPDIPPAANVRPGQQVRVQYREWTAAAVSTLLLVVRFPIAQ
jgi:formamidase